MAKEKKKKSGSKIMTVFIPILVVVLVIVGIAASIFVIFDSIVESIIKFIAWIVEGTLNFFAHPIKTIVSSWYNFTLNWQKEFDGDFPGSSLEATLIDPVIKLSQAEFIEMRNEIDTSINRDIMGLDDIMLKKMFISYNTGKYTKKTKVVIELTDEEYNAYSNDKNLVKPFKVLKGSSIERIKENKEDKGKYFLVANGILSLKNENNEELVYFDEEDLEELYDLFLETKNTKTQFSGSLWKLLSTKYYTYSNNGIKMYSNATIEEKVTDWVFKDLDSDKNSVVQRYFIDDEYLTKDEKGKIISTVIKKCEMQDNIQYQEMVMQYATPVEFMVDLLNISSSREFVEAFIEKVQGTEITLKTYRIYNMKFTEEQTITTEETSVEYGIDTKVEVKEISTDGSKFEKWNDDKKEQYGEMKIEVSDEYETQDEDGNKITKKMTNGIKIRITNINKNIKKIKLKVIFEGTTSKKNIEKETNECLVIVPDDENVGYYETNIYLDNDEAQYTKKKKNNSLVWERLTFLEAESHIEMAVERAETWYGTFEYENYIEDVTDYTSDTGWKACSNTAEKYIRKCDFVNEDSSSVTKYTTPINSSGVMTDIIEDDKTDAVNVIFTEEAGKRLINWTYKEDFRRSSWIFEVKKISEVASNISSRVKNKSEISDKVYKIFGDERRSAREFVEC